MTWLRVALGIFVLIIFFAIFCFPQYLAQKYKWPFRRVIPKLFHKIALHIINARISVSGNMTSGRPLLITANHLSWIDIIVISSIEPACFVAKSEVATWPVISWLAKLQGSVFVERKRPQKAKEQALEMADKLESGDVLLLFPEGTSSDGNRIFEFKSALLGATRLAVKQGGVDELYVQPLSVCYTELHGLPIGRMQRPKVSWVGDVNLLNHFVELVKCGSVQAELAWGEPIKVDAKTDRKILTKQAEDCVRQMVVATNRGLDLTDLVYQGS